MSSASASRYKKRIAELPCLICAKLGWESQKVELHHVAEGSGLRSDFALVPLCPEHHRGKAGLHGMGTKRFCAAYRIPGETEMGLLVLQNEVISRSEQ
jgi:hypothetical protein